MDIHRRAAASIFLALLCLCYIRYSQPSGPFGSLATRGSFYFYTTKFCFIRDCALNSVDSTYGVITFPSRIHSNEFDRVSFDLRHDEYLDINMITPYECFYFGWGIYLMDRWFDYKYQQYGASLNDTLNSFRVGQSLNTASPFRKEIRLFVSYNDLVLDELRRLYGTTKNNYFYLTWNAFSPDTVPYNATGDRLSIYFRILMPTNNTLLAQYVKENPVSVYRYKMDVGVSFASTEKPVGVWNVRSADGLNEPRLAAADLENLHSQISRVVKAAAGLRYTLPLNTLVTRHSIEYDSGHDCIRYRKVCYIDNRDTVYAATGLVKDNDVVGFSLQLNSIVLVVGVNHTYYNNSLYNSLQLYDYTSEQGFFSFHGFENIYENSRSYKNSCKTTFELLGGGGGGYQFAPEQFYCIMISRNNFTDWGMPQELSAFYKTVSETEIPFSHLFATVERSYLQSALSVSAAYKNLLLPLGTMLF